LAFTGILLFCKQHSTSGAETNLKVGGTHVRHETPEKNLVVSSTFWLYKYNRFGERFRGGKYTVWSVTSTHGSPCAQPFVRGGTCPPCSTVQHYRKLDPYRRLHFPPSSFYGIFGGFRHSFASLLHIAVTFHLIYVISRDLFFGL